MAGSVEFDALTALMQPTARISPLRDRSSRRLLFLCNNASYFSAHWGFRAASVARSGFDVTVAVPNPPAGDDGVPWTWHPYPVDRRGLGPFVNLAGLRATQRVIDEVDPEIAVPITIKPNLFAALVLAFHRRKRPLVMNVTGLGFLFTSNSPHVRLARRVALATLRWCARRNSTWAVFENSDDRTLLVQAGAVAPARAMLLGGAGVDTRLFTEPTEPATHPPLVVLPARMLWDKGVGHFVEAARLLRADGVEARLVLVGDTDPGNPSAIPAETLRGWAAEECVEWWGHCDDMPAVIRNASVVCLPTFYREGIPRVLMEAASCARAIVTTDNVGCRDFIQDGVNGRLVPIGDVPALARAIRELVAQPWLRQRLGAAARQQVERHYSQELVAERTIALYRRAVLDVGSASTAADGVAKPARHGAGISGDVTMSMTGEVDV